MKYDGGDSQEESKEGGGGDEPDLLEVFEELSDLAEISRQNTVNMCMMGGLAALLKLICTHHDNEIRKAACRLIS